MTGIGGDCFTLIAKPGKPVWGYNGCGRAGARASDQVLRDKGMEAIGSTSVHAVTVPGSIEAWEAILKAHGRFGLDRALQPAIKYAEDGFPVAARVAWDWERHVAKLKADPAATRHYLFDGKAPKEGDVVRLPALAETLKSIAAKGARAFYEGEIAQDMVATIAARGSFLTAEDFASHRGNAVDADLDQLSRPRPSRDTAERPGPHRAGDAQHPGEFRSCRARSARPRALPSGAGGRALGICRARQPHRRPRVHARLVADLLDKGFAKKLAGKIDLKKRAKLPPHPTPGSDTVYLTVVDRDRMALLLHQLALFELRHRHLHREDRHPAQQPRLLLHARARPSQRVRPGQAADAHHHSGAWPCAMAAAT